MQDTERREELYLADDQEDQSDRLQRAAHSEVHSQRRCHRSLFALLGELPFCSTDSSDYRSQFRFQTSLHLMPLIVNAQTAEVCYKSSAGVTRPSSERKRWDELQSDLSVWSPVSPFRHLHG